MFSNLCSLLGWRCVSWLHQMACVVHFFSFPEDLSLGVWGLHDSFDTCDISESVVKTQNFRLTSWKQMYLAALNVTKVSYNR